jgi:hypothetical protein
LTSRRTDDYDVIGGIEFPTYPEQIDHRWHPRYEHTIIDPNSGELIEVVVHNDNRKSIDLPTAWKDYDPKSRRNPELGSRLQPLSKAAKQEILDSAVSREDFHDYDRIHNQYGAGFWGCLCELRFITGTDCIQHLEKDADGEYGITKNTPNNRTGRGTSTSRLEAIWVRSHGKDSMQAWEI